jgi:isopentenyl phosphate kinase
MVKNIQQIADQLGAKIVGQVPDTGGGGFGAARLAKAVEELATAETDLGSLGALREDAELLDQIVADAMRQRQISAWRPRPEDFAALEAIAVATNRTIYDVLDEAVRLLISQLNY